ncbi:MAG: hypothetical protein HC869_02375 [Rhodospirillales bacterium]|nr:hypothetical protein [Rhodospirillales bacterium]
MTAYLIVRAEVPEADRSAFDRWYETEHLRDAKAAFAASAAARGWSDVTPGLHVALYAFPDLATARAVLESDAIKTLIAAFDRVWQGRVPRSRDIVEVKQSL